MSKDTRIGLIPAAGKGLRLGLPFPKELFPILEEDHYIPVAKFVFDNLLAAGITHIVFVINETKSQLIKFFGNGSRFNCNISYVVQEMNQPEENGSTSPGLAKALNSAYHLIKGKTVYFGMADTILKPNNVFSLGHMEDENEFDLSLFLFKTTRPEKFGMVRFDNFSNRILEIVDKPQKTDLQWMWGSIVWGPRFSELLHDLIDDQAIVDFAAILNSAVNQSFLCRGIKVENGTYIDIGTFDEMIHLIKKSEV